jgi:nicotinamide-nucleotide amidase
MNSSIITIGDELLIGQVINTNQAYIARKLNDAGFAVDRMVTVGDSLEAILAAFDESWRKYDVVIVTGGLGPTHDDITKNAVCRFFDSPLERKPELKTHIEQLFNRRGLTWSPAHEEQTLFPSKAEIVSNPVGTAAGIHFKDQHKHFFVLPGVPYEMKEMMDASIGPLLASLGKGNSVLHRTLRTTGVTESFLAQQLGPVQSFLGKATLAFLPSPTGVRLRISLQGADGEHSDSIVNKIESFIRTRVGRYIYGTDDEEIEEVIGRILTERRMTIAVAESCTGGLLADRITDVSGSSAYFERGIVTYSNRSKTDLLGVPSDVIAKLGAVSEDVARMMAEGVRRIAGTDIGVSTTGIAGPTGGSPEKPLGLVWVGYADANESFASKFSLGTLRNVVKQRAAQAALDIVWKKLSGSNSQEFK